MEAVHKARCVHCRSEVSVPDAYPHGDIITCGSCRTKHKIVRGEVLRLVLADVAPLRDALHTNQALVERLEAELSHARGSFGIGANGLGIGLIYALWQIALKDRTIDSELAWEAVFVIIGAGLALEVANFLFLAKRKKISRLSQEISDARTEGRELERKIREASRV
jgi:hypothetical protein